MPKLQKVRWKDLTLEDKTVIDEYYREEGLDNCEGTFANNWLWSPHYGVKYSIIDGFLVFGSKPPEMSLRYPLGKGNKKEVILYLMEYCKEMGVPFVMHLVSPEQYEELDSMFPEEFEIDYDRDAADYVYETVKLARLPGKKLHGKRNHINRFKEQYPDWSYETITGDNREECIEMAFRWREINGCAKDPEKFAEFCVTLQALKFMEKLKLRGGLLRVDGKVVGFSIGEPCSLRTFVVHIEKAFADIQGAYPMINQQFVLHEAMEYEFVNREEDMGSEGLRKAKLSYQPIKLLQKGRVRKG